MGRKQLEEVVKLEDQKMYKDVGFFGIVPYIAAFKSINKVVDCYFTSKSWTGPSLAEHIMDLHKSLKAIDNLYETLKIHVILQHVEERLIFIEKTCLGCCSKQSRESVHCEFLKFSRRYKLNTIQDESYSSKLLQIVNNKK